MGKSRLERGVITCAVALTAMTAMAACTLISGAGELETGATSELLEAGASSSGASPDSSGQTPGESDASVIGTVDATIVNGCNSTNCEVLPDGFQLVAATPSDAPAAECPMGFAQPFDAVEQPTLDPGACTCGCNVTQNPTCNVPAGNSLTLLFGPAGSGACTQTGQEVPTGCSQDGYMGPFFDYDRRYMAPAATLAGGTCNANGNKDNAKLRSRRARVCQATVVPQCEGKTCAPDLAASSGYSACIAALGARECPATWPKKRSVGTSANFTCGGGCSCSVQGNCGTSGTLSYFATENCSGQAGVTYPVNNNCNATMASNNMYASHRYDPATPGNIRCQVAGSSAPSAPTLAQETTVCCK